MSRLPIVGPHAAFFDVARPATDHTVPAGSASPGLPFAVVVLLEAIGNQEASESGNRLIRLTLQVVDEV